MTMLYSLDTEPHPTYAGLPVSQISPKIRERLERRVETLGEDLAGEVEQAVAASTAALDNRHALIHSLWPNPTMEQAQGWRSKRVRGSEYGSEVIWTKTNRNELQACLDELVRLSEVVVGITSKIWGVRATQPHGVWPDV